MKLTLNIFEKRQEDEDKRWPNYVFGGRLRTSTLVLVVAFFALLWLQAHELNENSPSKTTTVVPPPPPGYTTDNHEGTKTYVPDPNSDYTLVPRTRLQPPSTTTEPPPTTTTITTTTPPPFQPPCIPPFCTPSPTTPTSPSQLPQPGPGPVPTPAPPAR
ncbi:hypothetical protein A5791_06290 [Mycobacterium sp. 852002-51163_SCH5372311]|uniref:hypothetical protein n=1 Tax=Mycobacterium sp. 852002-51163_SCH5372311 TaxID=1834097 RepID=UPI0007FF5875|nr:hypothetical protein [Mycobacterium sp. 852002-51163_SCH5372311]OBF81243.1 hypothetical protein A5791_06290 [Mycobacterium sp. 852002-51163_SCH5372311]